jgi:hypothetical protein
MADRSSTEPSGPTSAAVWTGANSAAAEAAVIAASAFHPHDDRSTRLAGEIWIIYTERSVPSNCVRLFNCQAAVADLLVGAYAEAAVSAASNWGGIPRESD